MLLDVRMTLSKRKPIEVTIKGVSYAANGPCNAPAVPIIVDVDAPNTANMLGMSVVQHKLPGIMAATTAPTPNLPVSAPFLLKAKALITTDNENNMPIDADTMRE
jgi:hypothetical protein